MNTVAMPDLTDRKFEVEYAKLPMPMRVSDYFDSNNMFTVGADVINYAPEEDYAVSLKFMLICYHNSKNALSEIQRAESAQTFVIFAESFAEVCLDAIKKSIEDE